MIRIAIVFIVAHTVLTGATAQNAYKCGNTYSQSPCAGGTVVQADDGRSAEQRSQTQMAAERDAKTAAALEKDRLRQEAGAAPAYIPPPKEQPNGSSAKPVMTKPGKPQHFTAVAPAKPGDAKPRKGKPKAKKEKAAKQAAKNKSAKT